MQSLSFSSSFSITKGSGDVQGNSSQEVLIGSFPVTTPKGTQQSTFLEVIGMMLKALSCRMGKCIRFIDFNPQLAFTKFYKIQQAALSALGVDRSLNQTEK